MASISEKSFGQRYTKAGELAEYLNLLTTYTPPTPDLSSAELKTFLVTVDTANNDASAKLSALQTEREQRYNLFKAPDGLITRCAQIRDYIAAIHPQGKKALDYKKVQKAVMNLRGLRLSKKPPAGDPGSNPKTRSTSEQSFGSMLKVGKDVLEVIKTVAGYTPANTNLTVANLTTYLASMDVKNSSVAAKQETYDDAVEARADLYAQLDKKVSSIKLAIASQFGKTSNEFKDVVKY
jgi:hypothetical protein